MGSNNEHTSIHYTLSSCTKKLNFILSLRWCGLESWYAYLKWALLVILSPSSDIRERPVFSCRLSVWLLYRGQQIHYTRRTLWCLENIIINKAHTRDWNIYMYNVHLCFDQYFELLQVCLEKYWEIILLVSNFCNYQRGIPVYKWISQLHISPNVIKIPIY